MIKKDKKKRTLPAINTAALPDIIFMLLFFFMVTTVMKMPEEAEDLVLPNTITSESTERTDPKEFVISLFLDRENKDVVKIQNQVTSLINLEVIINKEANKMKAEQNFPEKAILKIDHQIKMSTVNKLKTALQKAEIYKVEYLHQAGSKSSD